MLAVLPGCEKELELSGRHENGIAVYAIAIPGRQFSMRVSHSFTVNDNPPMGFSLGYDALIDTIFRTEAAITNAQVEVTVNGTDKYAMTYNPERPYDYRCDYVPQEGDDIAVKVSAEGYKDVNATTRIAAASKVEIVKTQTMYKDNGDDGSVISGNPLERFGVDSVMSITLKINDPPAEHNFYRLRVLGVATKEEVYGADTFPFYLLSDVYTSDDIIFSDNMLTKPYAEWEAGFSNVFDDHLFNGKEYTFIVESRKRYGDNPHVVVELQSISPDLYYFLKSYQVFRISTDDVFTTPIGLYSNIREGWGIFGALSYDRHIIYY